MEMTIVNNPAFQQVIQKVRENGLHKVAEHIYGEELTLKTAVQRLATQMTYNSLKRQKIASGLQALNQVEAFKKGQMFQMGQQGVKSVMPEAEAVISNLLQRAAKPDPIKSRGGLIGMPEQAVMRSKATPSMSALPKQPVPPVPTPASKEPLFGQYAG